MQQPTWLLNELTSAGRENLGAVHVSQYDAKEDASATAEVDLFQTFGLDERSEVWTLALAPVSYLLRLPQSVRA